MTNVKGLLEALGMEPKVSGSQLQVDCPECDDSKKHLYIKPDTEVGYCHKCSYSPNPYMLVEKVTPKRRREIFEMLEQFNLADEQEGIKEHKVPTTHGNKIMLNKDDIRSLTEAEIAGFCGIKQIETSALVKFRPFAHAKEPWMLLPAFTPCEDKACGWLRCALDGQPITLSGDNTVKYPIVAGSRHGLFGTKWLQQENPDAIVFCEAWRDALSAISIGLHATASSGGASKWDDDWLPLFTGKIVYICMDADEAGQRATARAAERIATVAKDVYIVKLPYEITESHGKDLHDYIVADGHGKDFLLLLSRAEKYGFDNIVLKNNYPMTIAEKFHEELVNDSQIWRHYNHLEVWCRYDGKVYKVSERADVKGRVWRFASRCVVTKKEQPDTMNCTDNIVKNTLSAMSSFDGVEIVSDITAPAWLTSSSCSSSNSLPEPEYVIAVNNGLLDMSGDTPKLMKHTPGYLNFNILEYDYDYDNKAECPGWIKFLGEVFEKKTDDDTQGKPDMEKIHSLQEWYGLLLTSEMKYHKMLGIIGPKRSGKSTIARILTAMVGAKNIATPTFASMTDSFGLQGFLNAKVAVFGDANMDKDPVVVSRAIEKLKTISGEDAIDVNRKHKQLLTGVRLKIRFVMISNNLQRLTDPTGTVSGRFIFLKTTQSFYGNEDKPSQGL